jgi:CheY-like chemotaxis protein
MKRFLRDIKIISVSLGVLYFVTLVIYMLWLGVAGQTWHAVFMVVLSLSLLTACAGVFAVKEWGRLLIIGASLLQAVYLSFALYFSGAHFSSPAYIFISVIIALFFAQAQMRARFRQKSEAPWRSILVVDDDQTVLRLIRPILMKEGFSVLTASTGEEGQMIATQQQPDLILLDVILPGLKGREVCQNLKDDARTQHIPIVFLTAKDTPDDINAELEAGAVKHLTKPVSSSDLVRTVKKILN